MIDSMTTDAVVRANRARTPRAPAVGAGVAAQRRGAAAARMLGTAAALWLGVAVLGQLVFAVYVAGFYGRAAVNGRPQDWNAVLAHGYVPGDTFLNAVLALHLAFAAAIVVGGAVQMLPSIRRDAPRLHRWNGRAYIAAAAIMSIGGMTMVWTRGTVGDLSQHVAITLNALLIVGFSIAAWRNGAARRIDAHRRYALRLFLAVSGVWFFRVGLMFWLLVNGGPVGFDPKSFTGPTLTLLAFAQWALPLALLELYFRAQRASSGRRFAMAIGLGVLTVPMAVGIAAAAAIMWLPHLLG